MKTSCFTLLVLTLFAQAASLRAEFTGYYAIPMNGSSPLFTTTSSIPVGNWTLSASQPGTVAELYRAPAVPTLEAVAISLTSMGGAPVSLSITVPSHGPLECLFSFQWTANVKPGGALWLIDGDGLQLLADSSGPVAGNTVLQLIPGEPLALIVSGGPWTTVQVQAITPLPAPANVEAFPATALAAASATLNGRVFYWELPTRMWFEWGSASFTKESEATVTYATACGADVLAPLVGLQPDTTYQFRVAASNEAGLVRSAPIAFTTARVPVIAGFGIAASGARQLDYQGTGGAAYTVWGSASLTNWQSLGSAVEVSSGHFRFIDAVVPPPARQFYRVSSP
jgi:hypothetical protein